LERSGRRGGSGTFSGSRTGGSEEAELLGAGGGGPGAGDQLDGLDEPDGAGGRGDGDGGGCHRPAEFTMGYIDTAKFLREKCCQIVKNIKEQGPNKWQLVDNSENICILKLIFKHSSL
jgi:hypothetical protein